jgi:hypothetical protein
MNMKQFTNIQVFMRRYRDMVYTIMKYLRISSEDIDLDGLDKYESNSIAHQRALLDDFISKMPEFGGCEILEAIDDGRTGTNFNRPGVQLSRIYHASAETISKWATI